MCFQQTFYFVSQRVIAGTRLLEKSGSLLICQVERAIEDRIDLLELVERIQSEGSA